MFEIVAAHGISYAATASIGYIEDFIQKVQKAAQTEGTSYIHVLAPCPTGWGIPSDETVEVAKEVVDTGLWYLAEFSDGEFHLTKKPKEFADVEHYLMRQSRFKHLQKDDIENIIRSRNKKWEKIIEWSVIK
jgi:pyruvate ferredoxin oxidoreductase beta subunit